MPHTGYPVPDMTPRHNLVRTVPSDRIGSDRVVWEGCLAKARQFIRVAHDACDLAESDSEIADAAVTL